MNRYRALSLKEIHKLPKLAMCGVTYVNVSFPYSSNLSIFSMNDMNRSLRLLV